MCIRDRLREYPKGITFQEIAREYQSEYQDDIVLVKFQNNLRELKKMVVRDGKLQFITTADKAGRDTYRRSATLLMETAAGEVCLLYTSY